MTIVRSASYGLELSASRVRLSVRALWAWCTALVIVAGAAPALGAQGVPSVPAVDVDHAVISQLVRDGIQQPKIISHVDLTKPFDAASQWTLVIAREDVVPTQAAEFNRQGPLVVCIVKVINPDCSLNLYQGDVEEVRWFATPFEMFNDRVVYAGRHHHEPLLLVQVCSAHSADGNCGRATVLYRYARRADRFVAVFHNVTGNNNNQRTRFIEGGPLRGDVIVDVPTEHAPYTYWIDVYRRGRSGPYARILRYRGRTHYGDGNPLAVIDSEMPEILRHFGLWHVGDPPSGSSAHAGRLYSPFLPEW